MAITTGFTTHRNLFMAMLGAVAIATGGSASEASVNMTQTEANTLVFSDAALPANFDTCFSPDQGCDEKLISFMHAAKSSLDIAIYSLTLRDVVTELVAAKARGVTVRVIADREQSNGRTSVVPDLVGNGLDVRFATVQGVMHNKFTIVDGKMIETGSYNYSFSATKLNAENQLYLSEVKVVAAYREQFEKLYAASTQDTTSAKPPSDPTPSAGQTN